MSTPSLQELKDRHRAGWAAGDYAAMAERIAARPPADVLAAVAPVAGTDLLDIATGTGNAALAAAALGATVTGLDLTPELLAIARGRDGAQAVTWIKGDAEALPFADRSFDRVVSVFGVQFAPRAEAVASELARVCRPGGAIALANWSADGLMGKLSGVMGAYLPAPPAFVTPPTRWGDEAFLHELLGPLGEVRIRRAVNRFSFPSVSAYADFYEERSGQTMMAKAALGERWAQCRADLMELYESLNTATDGTAQIDGEYLVVTVRPR